jgi:hypothetical protein
VAGSGCHHRRAHHFITFRFSTDLAGLLEPLHKADRPRAMAELTTAQRLRPGLTYALAYLAVQARVELARCYLALADVPAARVLLQEAAEVLARRPGLGTFARQAEDLRAELAKARGSSALGAFPMLGWTVTRGRSCSSAMARFGAIRKLPSRLAPSPPGMGLSNGALPAGPPTPGR